LKKETEHIVLKASDLSVWYQSKKETHTVAKQINFELKKGELVGLVGGNGIGKSTLLRTLTNTQQPLAGTIHVNNQELTKINQLTLAKQLSVVLTENVSQTNLSVQELIALGRQPYTNWLGTLSATDIEKTVSSLDVIQIKEFAHKKCFELSDGQLQKVMLARALAQDTDLIILDEPTTHLDLYHKVYILKLLQRLAKETNKTILFSTHEINVALSMCDKLIVMKQEKTHFGTPQELISNNAFDDLFPKDLVAFDLDSGSFKIK